MTETREQMNIVVAGHVDHGKSTVVGRLMADTGSLPDGKLEAVKANCERNAKPFEYAFLIDALKDEQEQGITIDCARVFFKTEKRNYIIIDAPGHIEFLKNMITGASRAEAALLVIDANEGVQENSRRHGYMMAMLGVRQLTVLVNKIDLIDYDEKKFLAIVEEYKNFLNEIGVQANHFVPVSGFHGDNIASLSEKMPWYKGANVLETLDDFKKEAPPLEMPFRMPVQGVYKFTNEGDDRRIVAGTVETGRASVGDEVIFYPSGKKSRIKSFEQFNGEPPKTAEVGDAVGFTLEEQIYIQRGEMATLAKEMAPKTSKSLVVSLFWLGRQALEPNKDYDLKLGSAKIPVRLAEVRKVINASNLDVQGENSNIGRHEVAECVLQLRRAVAFDLAADLATTSRFVIVDNYEIAGGGIIKEYQEDEQAWVREKVIQRNLNWEKSHIGFERRAERYNQKAHLILVSGHKETGRKELAKNIEEHFFKEGKMVYYLAIGSVVHGVDADLEKSPATQAEHMRRLAEVAHMFMDAGLLLVVTARDLTAKDIEILRTGVAPERISTVWMGPKNGRDFKPDLHFDEHPSSDKAIDEVKELLKRKNVLFDPQW